MTRTPSVPTQATCPVCDQVVDLVDVTAVPGSRDEFSGRFVAHERVVVVGKPPRPCPSLAYVSHPERYDTD